jgi:hypothetical protein
MEKESALKGPNLPRNNWNWGYNQMKLHKLLALSLFGSLAVMWAAPGSGALAQEKKKWKGQVVGTDADNDWGANVDPRLAPVGDELGQELVEAHLRMPDAETVNFVIRVKSLPANDAGVPEFTRYGWDFSVDGRPMLISGGFTEVLRTFCYPLHSQPRCPPSFGDPQQSLEHPFFVHEGACTVGTGGVSDCRVKAVVSATFEHRSLHAGTGMITVPIPLEAIGAKPGSKIGPAEGALGGTIYASPAVIVASGNFPNDTMLVTKTFVVPGG